MHVPTAQVVLILTALVPRAAGVEPLVPATRGAVQPEIDRHLAGARKANDTYDLTPP